MIKENTLNLQKKIETMQELVLKEPSHELSVEIIKKLGEYSELLKKDYSERGGAPMNTEERANNRLAWFKSAYPDFMRIKITDLRKIDEIKAGLNSVIGIKKPSDATVVNLILVAQGKKFSNKSVKT